MTHISHLPSQPFSLPPAFVTSFVRRCFTADLCLVDFTQALTAMDYLKDLENRRKRELTLALQRLELDHSLIDSSRSDIKRSDVGTDARISEWLQDMRDKVRKAEALYSQVYIGLRRWVRVHHLPIFSLPAYVDMQTLINEMRLEPFSKANNIAMLNTLYPPTTAIPPTRQLTAHILESQRNAFFRYIQAVEKNGKSVLKNLEHQGQRKDDVNGWTVVREVVDKYLRSANVLIDECVEITGPDYFDPTIEARRRGDRRADSGISFATGDRPSTGDSISDRSSASTTVKPLPATPPQSAHPLKAASSQPMPKKRGTTLEKIAREFRNLRSRNDVKEITRQCSTPDQETKVARGHSLKKMKSTGSMRGGKSKHARTGSNEAMTDFQIDDARRQRMIWEAQREKENRVPPSTGPQVRSGDVDTEL